LSASADESGQQSRPARSKGGQEGVGEAVLPRQSAIKRLRRLPPVFTLNDMSLGEGMTPGAARVTLARWNADGLARPAGPRLGLWYNLVTAPSGADEELGTVLKRQFGAAVLIGPSVLNDHGWTTQAPRSLTVAVPTARSHPCVDGASTYPRPAAWFSLVHRAWRRGARGRNGLPSLPPEFALADALCHADCLHHLAPDDIEIPQGSFNAALMLKALDALQVPPDTYMPYMEASGIELEETSATRHGR
jgi:hypothetical protein